MKKVIVVSGINLVSGGTLSVFRDCLMYLKNLTGNYQIIALVNNKGLFKDISNDIMYYEYPLSKKAWLFRCFYEYIWFYFLSKEIKPYIWISLHDITPNVQTGKLCVYCHNPSPFYSLKYKEIFLDKKFTLFTWFYSWLYRINIKKNDYVIVQQEWLRNEFKKGYGLSNIIVAHPKLEELKIRLEKTLPATFIYPTFPRVFKNIEVICEAFKLIDDLGARVFITIDGSENKYAKMIVEKYSYLKSINFIGLQNRKVIFDYYGKVSALIFPSKLETWGMPMSEFAVTNKPIFASDTKFCRETLAGYKNAVFFDQDDTENLANMIKKFIEKGEFIPSNTTFINTPPYAKNWDELFDILLGSDLV